MATIYTLKNVTFNKANKKFHSVKPALLKNSLERSLSGAWRFSNRLPLTDISGNGSKLSAIGNNIQFTEHGFIGTLTNGFRTNIKETPSYTLIAVSRLPTINDGAIFMVGNHIGSNNSDTSHGYGGSIYYTTNSTSGIATPKTQSFGVNTITDVQDNSHIISTSDVTENQFIFSCMTLDADSETMSNYIPTLGFNSTLDNSDFLYSTRELTPEPFHIAARIPFTTYNSSQIETPIEIAEVLIFNKALSKEEIDMQYEISKKFMEKEHGITI